MTRYEMILSLGNEFTVLVASGLIPAKLPNWKAYYEAYLQEKKATTYRRVKTGKTEVIENVAAQHAISGRMLFNIIAFMEG